MFQSLRIKGFRGFSDLEVKELGQVNLFAGRNNVGKSSLLEAILLLSEPERLDRIIELAQSRGQRQFPNRSDALRTLLFLPLFHGLDSEKGIELKALEGDEEWRCSIFLAPEGALASRYGSVTYTKIHVEPFFEMADGRRGYVGERLECWFQKRGDEEARFVQLFSVPDGIRLMPPVPTTKPRFLYLPAHNPTSIFQLAARFGELERSAEDLAIFVEGLRVIEPSVREVRTVFEVRSTQPLCSQRR